MRVLVTAGTKGLGRAIVDSYIKEGAQVATCARTQTDLDELQSLHGEKLFTKAVDLMDVEALKSFVSEVSTMWNGLDTLVVNPPHSIKIPISELSTDDWQKSFDAIYQGMNASTNAALPTMIKQGSGSVVVISSVAAIEPIDIMPASSVLRGGVAAWVKLMARQYGPQGIRFNSVQPGFNDTPAVAKGLKKRAEATGKTLEEFTKDFVQNVPLRRMGDPSEVANTVLFLASEKASYITGTNILVDGGLSKGV